MAENSHPSKLMLPNEAIAAGTKKTPDPIILPTTSEVLVQIPNFFDRLAITIIGFFRLNAGKVFFKYIDIVGIYEVLPLFSSPERAQFISTGQRPVQTNSRICEHVDFSRFFHLSKIIYLYLINLNLGQKIK